MTLSGAGRRQPQRGRWGRTRGALVALALGTTAALSSACYTFGGNGGFPPDLKTVAVIPFDNLTGTPEVQRELNEFMRRSFRDRLNLRDASEEKADVIVRGVIGKYDVDLPAGVSADPREANLSRRVLQLVIDVEIINQKTGQSLLKQAGMQSQGQYAEGQEATGRRLAIENLVDKMVQGTQSQW